jgi:hypothetical protein
VPAHLPTDQQPKKLIGLPDRLNLHEKTAPEEESAGKGSSCNYPSVHVQIDPFDWTTIDSLGAKNAAQFEAVSGVGDAAFLRANKMRSVEFAEPVRARRNAHPDDSTRRPDGSSTAGGQAGTRGAGERLRRKASVGAGKAADS